MYLRTNCLGFIRSFTKRIQDFCFKEEALTRGGYLYPTAVIFWKSIWCVVGEMDGNRQQGVGVSGEEKKLAKRKKKRNTAKDIFGHTEEMTAC